MIVIKLKELRLQKNIKIMQLAKMTGISRNTIYLLEKGETDGITFDTLNKLCNALNCNVGDILDHQSD